MAGERYVMMIDLKKCLGCKTCTIACNTENSVLTTKVWNPVLDTIKGTYPRLERAFLPRPCMHCSNPSCVKVCPTGATYKRDADGLVLVDYGKCIGCRYCMVACPYGVRVFNWERPERMLTENPKVPVRPIGVVEKCTFCVHRIDEAREKGLQVGTTLSERDNKKVVSPACVRECVGNARYFGDANDPDSEVAALLRKRGHVRLVPEAGTEPNVYYLGWEA